MGKYELFELLSSSETADVHLCCIPKNTAIKIFKKQNAFEQELEALTLFQNIPNIIKMQGYIDEDPTKAIFLEYASKGTLFSFVSNNNGLSEEGAHFFFKQIISVIETLHNQNIVHRDIKLENILLDDLHNPMLCDFGNVVFLDKTTDLDYTKSVGTQCCKAPELIKLQDDQTATPQEPQEIDLKKSEIFSLGVLLFTMVFCKQPFSKADNSDFFYKMLTKSKSKFWNLFALEPSSKFKDLINNLICANPSDRFSIQDIINHPWVKETQSSIHFLRQKPNDEQFI